MIKNYREIGFLSTVCIISFCLGIGVCTCLRQIEDRWVVRKVTESLRAMGRDELEFSFVIVHSFDIDGFRFRTTPTSQLVETVDFIEETYRYDQLWTCRIYYRSSASPREKGVFLLDPLKKTIVLKQIYETFNAPYVGKNKKGGQKEKGSLISPASGVSPDFW